MKHGKYTKTALRTLDGIKTCDLIHALRGDDHFIEHRHTSAHEPSVAPLRTHGQAALVAVRQDGRHLLRGLWPQHDRTLTCEKRYMVEYVCGFA